MQFVAEYRKTDCEINETTSCPEGLHEVDKFLPFLSRPIRRTDSVDDIERYKSYFPLARKNQGKHFTWKHYCDILLTDLKNCNVVDSLKKITIKPLDKPVKSDTSSTTLVKSGSSSSNFLTNRKPKKRSFVDIEADVESMSSADDVKFTHTPSKNILKKMCTEIRTLAQKTSKTVDHMTSPRYCIACGDVLVKGHKNCSRQRIKKIDPKKPITPGLLKSRVTKRPICFQSPMISSIRTSACSTDPQSKKATRRTLFK